MKPRPSIKPRTDENISLLLTRIYKHIRSIEADIKPASHYASRIKSKKAMQPKLRLVK